MKAHHLPESFTSDLFWNPELFGFEKGNTVFIRLRMNHALCLRQHSISKHTDSSSGNLWIFMQNMLKTKNRPTSVQIILVLKWVQVSLGFTTKSVKSFFWGWCLRPEDKERGSELESAVGEVDYPCLGILKILPSGSSPRICTLICSSAL